MKKLFLFTLFFILLSQLQVTAAQDESYEDTETEEVSEEEEEEKESESSDIGLLEPSLVIDRIFNLISNTIGRLTTKPLVKTIEELRKVKAKVLSEFKKGFIELPKIGIIKFKQVMETVQKKIKPKMIGILYDVTGKTVQALKAGDLVLKITKMVITGSIPELECEVVFFKNKGTLKQETASEGGVTFTLEFEKPFMIPTGLNRSAPIKKFEAKLSADQRYLQTKAQLFGTKTEEPSLIRLDLSYIPFTFKVQSKNISMSTVEPALKGTPLADVILKTLSLQIIPFPPSIKITGIADMNKAQIGMEGKMTDAQITAGLGTTGFHFSLDAKNWTLPYNLGTVHNAEIKVGTQI
ncbi:hypothetical protein KKA53_00760 [Candidatus Dependentiae bacterium]|nr:hypothetical protein [Candidatus Dependentiae bacterium]